MLQKFDERNRDILIYINGELHHRKHARISVFDSVVQGGDAVWEGLRVYKGRVFKLDRHIQRLLASAHALMFKNPPSPSEIREAVFETLIANEMRDETHIRLTLTRGEKITSGMDPRLNTAPCGLIVLAEWKKPVYGSNPIRLITTHIRRNSADHLDSKIHHNNLLNNIQAKMQANLTRVDDALMLDRDGFVSETNATNIFMAKNGILQTPYADACLPGITRETVLGLASKLGLQAMEKRLTLTEFYTADEVFVSGTMGELTPVGEIDGRKIIFGGLKSASSLFDKIKTAYLEYVLSHGDLLPD